MPKWSEYLTHARERGSLAFELYCVVSTPTGEGPPLPEILPEHLAYQAQLERDGALVFAGPLSDESGEMMEGMGMIIYRSESFETAKALAEADPMHQAGARSYVLRRWMINEGGLSVKIGLSEQTVTLA